MPSIRTVRAAVLAVCALCVLTLGGGYLTAAPMVAADGSTAPVDARATSTPVPAGDGATALRNANNVTVVTTQAFELSDGEAALLAFTGEGDVAYRNATYQAYFDVDPVSSGRWTVEYVAAEQLDGAACASVPTDRCTRNVYERANLTTGETERIWSRLTPRIPSNRYHDIDRVNATHLLVADIHQDAVYIVDTRTGEETWRWNATEAYNASSGGTPSDWTHLNDVELLDDGRVMVSLRNQDSVVFLSPGDGVREGWTLGSDGDHDTLYEQHNPDYIPPARGGPAVVVSDSENRRAVEYQRENGTWTRSWSWQDTRLQWPRDADRLPNGNTLVTDSHGNRVVEVTPGGDAVWNVSVAMPYEAERLGTGPESSNGPSMRSLGGESASVGDSLSDRAVVLLKGLLPTLVVNGLLYATPAWVQFTELLAAGLFLTVLLAWLAVEVVRSRVPVGRLETKRR